MSCAKENTSVCVGGCGWVGRLVVARCSLFVSVTFQPVRESMLALFDFSSKKNFLSLADSNSHTHATSSNRLHVCPHTHSHHILHCSCSHLCRRLEHLTFLFVFIEVFFWDAVLRFFVPGARGLQHHCAASGRVFHHACRLADAGRVSRTRPRRRSRPARLCASARTREASRCVLPPPPSPGRVKCNVMQCNAIHESVRLPIERVVTAIHE